MQELGQMVHSTQWDLLAELKRLRQPPKMNIFHNDSQILHDDVLNMRKCQSACYTYGRRLPRILEFLPLLVS